MSRTRGRADGERRRDPVGPRRRAYRFSGGLLFAEEGTGGGPLLASDRAFGGARGGAGLLLLLDLLPGLAASRVGALHYVLRHVAGAPTEGYRRGQRDRAEQDQESGSRQLDRYNWVSATNTA